MVNLLDAGRQLLFAATIDNRRFGTQSLGRADGIHRHVTATNHYDPFADVNRRIVLRIVGVHEVGTCEELVGRDYSVQVLALDAHKARQTGTRTDKDGIEALLVEQ